MALSWTNWAQARKETDVSTRSEALATQFEQAMAELVATIEGCPDAQWSAICGDERWTVAATAQHIGAQFEIERDYIKAAAGLGDMPSLTWDDINTANEQRAQQFSACTRAEAARLLKEEGPGMAALVRSLSDAQLDRTVPLPLADGASVSTQQLIEGGVLIDHARGHLKSIRAAG
jgi:hypothetical protein